VGDRLDPGCVVRRARRPNLAVLTDLPHVDGVRHRFIGANGIVHHVAEAGADNGDPVVLLHGWPQHWYEWRHLIPELAERHRVLAVDLRGFGWSDAPPFGYEKEELASDILALLDALGIDRVKLVGHDWGGWIGFLLCLRAPERFDRFLALGITHPWQSLGGGWRDLPRFWYQQVIITPGLGYALHRTGLFVRAALRSGPAGESAFDEVALSSFADNLAEPARARACVRLYRSFNFRELLPVIRGRYMSQRLTVPTRLIIGTEDAVLSTRLVTGWEAHADDMSVEIIPGCGHFIADERPDLVAAEARALFA
jgi:pimeloyl-ACP methyl ester carboxylesterase